MNTSPAAFSSQPTQWIHLFPLGAHVDKLRADRKTRVTYDTDQPLLQRLIDAFDPADPVLIDREHYSVTESGDTTAMGWIERLELRPDGLWGLARWTPAGEALISSRELRMLSPCASLGADGKPDRLISAALTNTPFFRGQLTPLAAKSDTVPDLTAATAKPKPDTLSDLAAATAKPKPDTVSGLTPAAAEPKPDTLSGLTPAAPKTEPGAVPGSAPQKQKEHPHMEKLKTLLGLPPDADDAAVIEAVSALVTAAKEADKAEKQRQACKAWEDNKAAFKDRAAFIALYTANPGLMRQYCAILKTAAPVTDASKASAPDFRTLETPGRDSLDAGYDACKTAGERAEYIRANRAAYAARHADR